MEFLQVHFPKPLWEAHGLDGKHSCFFLWNGSFCLYWFLNKMANSLKTLNPNDRIRPALLGKFTLIPGGILVWTDVLT